jgi:hypothetical protein
VLGYFETPKPLPKSISEPVLGKNGAAAGIGARAPEKN